ncbi:tyrosine-type recombinase/integrase [Paenibacillus sp. Leaf72]|uniref:tyrosine-type recombinase/integrase n=1 Tax=Paenibacillus sp. Leaf72 TaxID=1736234 RepID=UPI0006F751A8|nr:tyrosine-type recombinase/integrase [Paenibacillus sp. Leaf72]KQO04661.1 transposase [Paenibacillus sp. Leaf72]
MRVQEVILMDNNKRYVLIDGNGLPVIPVLKYLKYLDNTGKSRNTQKTYCYALKQYFAYLKETNKDHNNIRLEDLVEFVGWLRSPFESNKITPLKPIQTKRTEKTINLTVTAVTNFYDYLYRNEELPDDMSEKLMRQVFTGGRSRYKSFLHHVHKDKPSIRNILKIKEPRKNVETLSKEQVQQVLNATTNIRDQFLIQVLFETGLRIGEVLSLYLEYFKFDYRGHRIFLKDRGELENGAMLKTGERGIYVSQALMDLFDDYLYEVLDELDFRSNFVFVILRGENKGKPLTLTAVEALFKRLREKTGIRKLHPHLFRHTHATMYYQETKDIKQVQERLGHSQIQTTMNLYLHLSEDDIRKDWEKAQTAFQINIKDSR